jgi:cell division protein FtsW
MIALAQIKDTLTPKPSPQLYDVPLLYSMLMLIGVGFIMVMSASMPTAERLVFGRCVCSFLDHGLCANGLVETLKCIFIDTGHGIAHCCINYWPRG